MPVNEHRKLRSRFRGAILGLAMGDALGFPYRGRSRPFVSAVPSVRNLAAGGFARHESGHFPAGQYSDDTQTALAVVASIAEAGQVDGQIVAEHLIPLWRDHQVIDRTAASTEAMEKLLKGKADFESCGHLAGRVEADALPRAVPVGLFGHDRPESLPELVAPVISITHRDPLVAAAAAALAAAVAGLVVSTEIILGRLLDQMSQAAGRFHGDTAERILDFPRILSLTEYRALEQFDLAAFKSGRDPMATYNAGIPDHGLFVFLAAVYYFLRSPYDFEKTLAASLRAGGEVSTLCALTGSLSGAFLGEEALPMDLVEKMQQRQWLQSQSDALLEVWEKKKS